MNYNIAKIRAALEMARDYITSDLASERGAFEGYEGLSRIGEIKADIEANDDALAALAELERAAAVVDRSKFVRGEICGCQARPTHYVGEMDCPWHKRGDGQPPPAPVAEIREVVVTDEMGKKVYEKWVCLPRRIGCSFAVSHGIDMIAAVRSELGPALGLVEIREPTPEECERICTEYERLLMREGTCGGRDAFDAVRAVMWPKSEAK